MSPLRVTQLAVAALAVTAGVAACGGDDAPATTTATTAVAKPPAEPAICGDLRARVTGRVGAPEATELSGLALSATQPGVLWSHNDSGDAPRIFALRTDGSALATVALTGARAVDWEDMANGPNDTLLIADIGDNNAARDTITVYRVPEPRVADGPTQATATALTYKYPDGAHDAETLLADRRTGEIVIVTKRFSGRSAVYAGKATKNGGGTLRRAGEIDLGLSGLATGGDVSADGRTIAIRTYTTIYAWRRPKATTSLAKTITTNKPCVGRRTLLVAEGQGEAIALARDGRSFFTVPEGAGAKLRRYTPRNR